MRISESLALITGGGGAIGGALAKQFVQEGAHVVLMDANLEAAQRVGEQLPDGTIWTAVQCDISSETEVATAMSFVETSVGLPDILINNAAVSVFAPVWEVPLEMVTWMHDVNVLGTLHLIRACVPKMIQRGTHAHIVNVASMAGLTGGETLGAYAATKHAVVGLTDSLRADLNAIDANIGVTLVAPGAVKTQGLQAMRERTLTIADLDISKKMTEIMDATEQMVLQKGLEPEAVAEQILLAIRNNIFWVTCPTTSVAAISLRSNEAVSDSRKMEECQLNLRRPAI